MSFSFVATQIAIVSLPIMLGWAANKMELMGGCFDVKLSRIVLNIGLPCMILGTLDTSETDLSLTTIGWILIGQCVLMAIAIALAYLVTALMHSPQDEARAYRFAVTFSNSGLIGFPIISAVLGERALLVAAIALIPCNLVIFTVGVLMFTGGAGGLRKQLRELAACCKTPTLLASFAVLVCALLDIHDLGMLGSSLDLVGAITTPAALLLTGSSLAKYPIRDMLTNWRAYVAAAGRLLLAPLAALAVLPLLPLESSVIAIIVLEGAMPVGANGILYCLQYGVDAKPMMQSTALSVIGAILTIPIVTMLACG